MNFSKNLISFLSDSMEHPQLKYYCNQKANAIAPKITDKAKTAVQQQVNQTFIDTIVSTIAGTGDSVTKMQIKKPVLLWMQLLTDLHPQGLHFQHTM